MSGFLQKISFYAAKYSAWCLVFLWVVSLFFKILAWNMEPAVGRDAALYLLTVREWQETGVYSVSWIPPVLYVLVRGVMALGFDTHLAGVIVNIAMGSLLVFVCFGIVYEATHNKKASLVAALFAALHPGINDLSIEIQRDIPYLFFAGAAVWIAIAAYKRKKWYLWAGAGTILAVSFLTRYETAELILLFPLLIIAQAFCKRISWKQAVLFCSTLMVFMAATFFAFLYLTGTQEFLKQYERYYTGKFKAVEKNFKTPQNKESK